MGEYVQGVLFYTEAEMKEAVATQQTQFNAGTEYGVRATKNDLNTKAIEYFRNEVREGTMDKDDALGIYNGLAEALGWTTLDNMTALYTVVISYNGNTIAEFSDVEADDEDSAEQEVRDNLDIQDIEISFTLSYNGDSQSGTDNLTYAWDEDFEYSVTEQE